MYLRICIGFATAEAEIADRIGNVTKDNLNPRMKTCSRYFWVDVVE
jgi:hypothetical protein